MNDPRQLISYLRAHEDPRVYAECWRQLAEKALRLAYSRQYMGAINLLLENAPPDIAERLVVWFGRLGIEYDSSPSPRAVRVRDLKKQSERFQRAKTLPLELPAQSVSAHDLNKPWFDDLELAEKGCSVHAYQGGRASGK